MTQYQLASAELGRPALGARAERTLVAPVTTFSRVVAERRLGAAAVDSLLELLPVGVLVADRNARVVYANQAARELSLDRVPELQWLAARALLTAEVVRGEVIEVAAPPLPHCSLSVSVIPVGSAEPEAALMTVEDVSARVQRDRWAPLVDTLARL